MKTPDSGVSNSFRTAVYFFCVNRAEKFRKPRPRSSSCRSTCRSSAWLEPCAAEAAGPNRPREAARKTGRKSCFKAIGDLARALARGGTGGSRLNACGAVRLLVETAPRRQKDERQDQDADQVVRKR